MAVQEAPTRDRAEESLQAIVQMFESGAMPAAITATVIARSKHSRPMHEWSLNNQLLAFLNGTDDARGFRQWQEVGRTVIKGRKAFYILAPLTFKIRDKDPQTGEDRERVAIKGFKGIPVFAYQDTEGEPLEDAPTFEPLELPPLQDVAERLGVSVRYMPAGGFGARGYFSKGDNSIGLGTHDADTWFHELAHAAHASIEDLKGGQNARQEIIAETVSAVLCHLYGMDGYIRPCRDYVEFYAGRTGQDVSKAVVRLVADIGKVLDVILAG